MSMYHGTYDQADGPPNPRDHSRDERAQWSDPTFTEVAWRMAQAHAPEEAHA